MSYRRRLFSRKDLYNCCEASQQLFLDACKENFDHLISHSEDYRKISERLGIHSSADIQRPEDIPVIPSMLMKQHDFRSGRHLVMVTSSGTSGKKSRVRFEFGALISLLKMAVRVTKYRGIMSLRPTRYVIMGNKPNRYDKVAAARTAYLSTFLSPAISRKFVLKLTADGYHPDFESILTALAKYEKKSAPVRLVGFPAYTFFLFRILEERGLSFKLPKGSMIILGGGWKQFYQEAVDKETFYKLAEKTLGIGEESIIEMFSVVEHPILYCDCKAHHFHVPVYCRVVIRDPDTLEPLEHGKTGLVNLITPVCKATPILSVMTDDLGILHDGGSCPCGAESPYLEIVGRVAPESIKTCAAGASEILQGVKV